MNSSGYDHSYDHVPYESAAFAQSHPDRLYTIGRLRGLKPAPVTRCRVLELGCASGGNLVPMAYRLPRSEFVGIDLARTQVDLATELITALGLGNIEVRHGSIIDIDESWGTFDYIVCHGVYSWVAAPVREKILDVCRHNLAEEGVAYISYNVYPGWHLREMVRHMMLYHARQFAGPREQIEQARALLDFLAESLACQDSAYSRLLEDELQLVRQVPDYYLFHDHLEEINTPVYFHEFVRLAADHGLQYLAEAELPTMLPHGLAAEVREALERMGRDQVQREQYLDFLRNRSFRQSLLCHWERKPNGELAPETITGLLIASRCAPATQRTSLRPGVQGVFVASGGLRVETAEPVTKAALLELGRRWPRAVSFEELFRASRMLLEEEGVAIESPERDLRETLASDMLWCFATGALELSSWQPDFASDPGKMPRTCRLNRELLRRGRPVVNHRHENVRLDGLARTLLACLDGSRDRRALSAVLMKKRAAGELALESDTPSRTTDQDAALPVTVDRVLEDLAAAALLCGASCQ